jgi:hypothetical protein
VGSLVVQLLTTPEVNKVQRIKTLAQIIKERGSTEYQAEGTVGSHYGATNNTNRE